MNKIAHHAWQPKHEGNQEGVPPLPDLGLVAQVVSGRGERARVQRALEAQGRHHVHHVALTYGAKCGIQEK